MRRRIYVEGKPTWTENEPGGFARKQGHGGAAMGSFSGTVLKVGPSTEVRQEAQRKRREETRHE
jgi:hypothetical protein